MNIKFSNLVLFSFLTILAFSNNSNARIKCWTNSEGNKECGDKIPPEYTQQGYKELDKRGLVRDEKEKIKTGAELEEAKKQAAEIRKEKEKKKNQQAYDKMLLETYTSVDEIKIARDERINAVQSTIKLTRKRIIKLQYQLDDELLNSNDNNESDKIKSLKDQVSINQVFINKKIDEQEEIKKSYTEYIERFKKLKGYK